MTKTKMSTGCFRHKKGAISEIIYFSTKKMYIWKIQEITFCYQCRV